MPIITTFALQNLDIMELSAKYDPRNIEDKWYLYWMDKKLFRSVPDNRPSYTIVIPPPNVTGVLHMGHMLNNTIQDVLIRRARMQGFNACWVPGTDHASIATEAKVVAKLQEEGINKSELTRDEFLKHAWEWKEKHGGIILEQLKKLGASCDWDRTAFTMDEVRYKSVIKTFVDLHEKGLIYRGYRMVNWDPKALTALSDEEVNHKEMQSKLYYLKYFLEDSDEFIVIATTRPETILADTAVCVNPNDERFKHLHGKKVLVPLINRAVPIITDEYVDMEFGTGCLKITPAHDENDYLIGQKFNLEIIDILTPDAFLNEKAQILVGEERFAARKKIMILLKESDNIDKIEDYINKVGFSERTDVPIEPRLSEQWFLKMADIAKPALEVVMNDEVQFYPSKFKNSYRHWMENVHDWCISRQLWWGQRIPVWYMPDDSLIVAMDEKEALEKAQKINPDIKISELRQDEDVLDTWFSSWLWPLSVFNGVLEPENEEIKYYYPSNDLVTAPEIMFFWVARMIMAGLEYRNDIPFKNVYFTGIVRDPQGRKMSKSLGNSPDPLKLIDKYGADGVRVGMLLSSPAGNDLLFEESLCEQGRNFANKIWNALRLVNAWELEEIPQPESSVISIKYFENCLSQEIERLDEHFRQFRMSDALMSVYKLIWDDFCSWYLELIKPDYQAPIDVKTYRSTIGLFEKLMQILHPFMPFLTEEIWHILNKRKENESIELTSMPEASEYDKKFLDEFEYVKDVIAGIRNARKEKNIAQKESLEIFYGESEWSNILKENTSVISKLAHLNSFEQYSENLDQSFTFLVRTTEFHCNYTESFNVEEEREKLQKELEYVKGFLNSVNRKLANEKFVKGAPEKVVESEKKKATDAEAKIISLENQIKAIA